LIIYQLVDSNGNFCCMTFHMTKLSMGQSRAMRLTD